MTAEIQPLRTRKNSLTEKAYRFLEEQIVEMRAGPGERISEAETARQLQISRGPVREALRQLESIGIVHRVANRGVRVANFEEKELEELDTLRNHLLALAGRLAAENATSGHLDKMKKIIVKMSPAVEAEDFSTYSALNIQFHDLLNEATGNTKLCQHLAQIYRQIRRYNLLAMSFPEGMLDSFESHKRIFGALAQHDPEAAEKELINHGQLSYQVLRANFKKLQRAFRAEGRLARKNGKSISRAGRPPSSKAV
ncbi:MAG: GntR family transcriptional regulator [bacterium]|nr:GntR family transcriptional regulator [bacterium]